MPNRWGFLETDRKLDCFGPLLDIIGCMKAITTVVGSFLVAGAMAQDFGAAVIDRPMNDLAHQITFISGVHASPIGGEISQWRLWAGTTGFLTLQMWRPVTTGFELVGANTVNVDHLGYNEINIDTGRIQVQGGDVIGFRYNDTTFGTRIIDFTSGAGGAYRWTNWPSNSTDVGVGGILLHSDLVGLGEGREYSLAATVVPEPFSSLVVGMGILCYRRRR